MADRKLIRDPVTGNEYWLDTPEGQRAAKENGTDPSTGTPISPADAASYAAQNKAATDAPDDPYAKQAAEQGIQGGAPELHQRAAAYDEATAMGGNYQREVESHNRPGQRRVGLIDEARQQAAPQGTAAQLGPTAQSAAVATPDQFRNAQVGLMGQLQDQAAGRGPSLAQSQLRQGTDRNLAQLMAVQAARRGGSQGALGQRQLMQAQGDVNQQAAQQAADLRMQEQMSARQQLAGLTTAGQQQDIGLRGQDINQNQFNANAMNQANLTQGAMNQQMAMGNLSSKLSTQELAAKYMAMGMSQEEANQAALNQASMNTQNLQQHSLDQSQQRELARMGYNAQSDAANKQIGADVGGGVLSAFGSILPWLLFKEGGLVKKGSGTKDDVPALLTKGEYVIPAHQVRANVAAGRAPDDSGPATRQHYAEGGMVQPNVDAQMAQQVRSRMPQAIRPGGPAMMVPQSQMPNPVLGLQGPNIQMPQTMPPIVQAPMQAQNTGMGPNMMMVPQRQHFAEGGLVGLSDPTQDPTNDMSAVEAAGKFLSQFGMSLRGKQSPLQQGIANLGMGIGNVLKKKSDAADQIPGPSAEDFANTPLTLSSGGLVRKGADSQFCDAIGRYSRGKR